MTHRFSDNLEDLGPSGETLSLPLLVRTVRGRVRFDEEFEPTGMALLPDVRAVAEYIPYYLHLAHVHGYSIDHHASSLSKPTPAVPGGWSERFSSHLHRSNRTIY
jgi:hypothetical protein